MLASIFRRLYDAWQYETILIHFTQLGLNCLALPVRVNCSRSYMAAPSGLGLLEIKITGDEFLRCKQHRRHDL